MALGMETETPSYVTYKYQHFMRDAYTEHSILAYWRVTETLVKGVVGEG